MRAAPPRHVVRLLLGIAVTAIATLLLFGFLVPASRRPEEAALGWTEAELALIETLSPIATLPPDPSNRVADDPRAAQLGKRLFFDTALSKNGRVACATCHEPERYFTDGRPTAIGLEPGKRNAPTLIGSQWSHFFFLDGRKDSLWSQALAPPEAETEMGTTRLALAHVIFGNYRAEYEDLFGPLPPLADKTRFPAEGRPLPDDPAHPHARAWRSLSRTDRAAVTRLFVNVGKCLEAYERKLLPKEAPFDRYVAALEAGDPKGGDHLTPAAISGLRAFIGRAQCINCHNGPLFTDQSFHNTGLPPLDPKADPDPARARGVWQVLADPFRSDGPFSDAPQEGNPYLPFLNPEFQDLLGAYKTPTLRNVAMTAPYGHAGQLATLKKLLEHYRHLPRAHFAGHRDLFLQPLDDRVSTGDLVAFLRSLTGPLPDARWLSRQ